MNDAGRAVAGFLLAPLIVAVLIACLVFVLATISKSGDFGGALLASSLAWGTALVIGLGMGLIFGLPAYLILIRLEIFSPWPTICIAAAIGALVPLISHWSLLDPSASVAVNGCQTVINGMTTACGYQRLAMDMIPAALIGAVAGLVFWLIYARGWRLRTDRSRDR